MINTNYVDEAIRGMFWLLVIFVPLGLWKFIDIIVWVFQHIKVMYE